MLKRVFSQCCFVFFLEKRGTPLRLNAEEGIFTVQFLHSSCTVPRPQMRGLGRGGRLAPPTVAPWAPCAPWAEDRRWRLREGRRLSAMRGTSRRWRLRVGRRLSAMRGTSRRWQTDCDVSAKEVFVFVCVCFSIPRKSAFRWGIRVGRERTRVRGTPDYPAPSRASPGTSACEKSTNR